MLAAPDVGLYQAQNSHLLMATASKVAAGNTHVEQHSKSRQHTLDAVEGRELQT